MVDAFAGQNLGHPLVFAFAKIVFGGTQNYLHIVKMRILRIRDIIGRIIEKNIVIVMTFQVLFDVESTAHAEHVGHFIGVFESKIQGVVSTKTASGNTNFFYITLLTNGGYKLLVQHTVVAGMVVNTSRWMQMFGVPTVLVNAINTIDLDFAGFDEPAGGFNQFEVLVFIITAH